MSSSYNVFINTHYLIQNIDRFSVLDSSEFVYPVIYNADKTDELYRFWQLFDVDQELEVLELLIHKSFQNSVLFLYMD